MFVSPILLDAQPSRSSRTTLTSSKMETSATSTGRAREVSLADRCVRTVSCSTLTSPLARIPVISSTTSPTSVKAGKTSSGPSQVSDVIILLETSEMTFMFPRD